MNSSNQLVEPDIKKRENPLIFTAWLILLKSQKITALDDQAEAMLKWNAPGGWQVPSGFNRESYAGQRQQ